MNLVMMEVLVSSVIVREDNNNYRNFRFDIVEYVMYNGRISILKLVLVILEGK